ncbi:hypothetical protein EZS27_032727 [termite gut metagenome]|uniref:DUF3298 domain-containing protein n=1 Tax=termite gut metagenome TaxID=433724 RepID=A0A5J4Q8Z7_9ZZZZ
MKKRYVVLFIVVCAATGFFCSCNENLARQGVLEFDNIRLTFKEHLFGDTTAPACNLTIDYVYPVQSSQKELLDSLNKLFVAACFGRQYTGQKSAEDVVRQYAKTYTDDYRNEAEQTYLDNKKYDENEDTVGTIDEWYSYTQTIKSNVQYYEGNLLVYRIAKEEYTGGAHGIYLTDFLNINLAKMRPLHLKDICKVSNYKELLTDMLWNQLMADNNATTREELEEVGYGATGDLIPSENFYLGEEDITFYYNVYEFTPYSMGPIEIRLPYKAVKHIINLE